MSVRIHDRKKIVAAETVDIGRFKVPFPYPPYQIQKDYMKNILNALDRKENALLESPTGSGKTLSLLAPVLAYIETCDVKPTVYFASRTHSQLKQAIDQLRMLTSLNATTLASRNHLCLNHQVKDLPSGVAAIKCRLKTNYKSKDSCLYYEGFKRNQKHIKALKLADIEDLMAHGRKTNICPYFTSRAIASQVDFVFLPYNYLFDSSKKDHFLVNLNLESGSLQVTSNENNEISAIVNKRKGAIIIFDEAHNLESVALSATSFEISLNDIKQMFSEIGYCASIVDEHELPPAYFDSLHLLVSSIKQFITSIPLSNKIVFKDAQLVYDIINKAGITNTDIIDKAIELLSLQDKTRVYLDTLATGIRILLMTQRKEDFKIAIEKIDGSTVLKYYCLHSGIAMTLLNRLFDQNGDKLINSFILTSGTLSPLDSFAFESGLDFQHQLSNPHVIEPFQLCIRAASSGLLKHPLNSSYDKRNDPKYIKDLGCSVIKIAEQVKGGVLVFFPAYALMDKCLNNWKSVKYQQLDIYTTLNKSKRIFSESKNRDEFEQIVKDFEVATTKGAILFAVCRGKASEGIDFRNDKCRAVVVIGLPFPNLGDSRVQLKKQYMDTLNNSRDKVKGVVSGSEWYKQQAIRAINQAIGRVIRHKGDYGAIILLDQRFCELSYSKYLPLWIRPFFVRNDSFTDTLNSLQSFFRNPKLLELSTVKRPLMVQEAPAKRVKVEESRPVKKVEGRALMDDLRTSLKPADFASFKLNLNKLKLKQMNGSQFGSDAIRFMKNSSKTYNEQRLLLSKLGTFISSGERNQYLSIVNSYVRK